MAAQLRTVRTFAFTILACGVSLACDGGPDDTTIALTVDPVTSPTNQATQVISGTTDPNSSLRIIAPTDTVVGTANSQGAFGLQVSLSLNALNSIVVEATDPAGNMTSQTVSILHDNIAPTVAFASPASPTARQSGFTITVNLSDESSGVDVSSFVITNDQAIGGAFKQDGTFSVSIAANTDLAPIFTSVTASQATYTVADTFFFPAGTNQLLAAVSDLAGNQAQRTLTLEVGPDSTRLIVVDATAAPSSSGNAIVVGLANGVAVSGVQFDLTYATTVIASVDSVTVGDRTSTFSDTPFNQITPGRVRLLLFDGGGDSLDQGQGPILNIFVTIDPAAPSGDQTLTLESIVASAPGGGTTAIDNTVGRLTVQ